MLTHRAKTLHHHTGIPKIQITITRGHLDGMNETPTSGADLIQRCGSRIRISALRKMCCAILTFAISLP